MKLEGAPGLQQEMSDQQCLATHRRTKRWEAHIWDDKKQVYLGGFDVEEHAGDYPCSEFLQLSLSGLQTSRPQTSCCVVCKITLPIYVFTDHLKRLSQEHWCGNIT